MDLFCTMEAEPRLSYAHFGAFLHGNSSYRKDLQADLPYLNWSTDVFRER